jgi:hypothetical protein
MAIDLTTPAASAADFRDRNGRVSSNDDTTIAALLLMGTRLVERRVGLAPGMLLPQAALTFTYTATGGPLLRLRDERGFQHLLQTATAVGIDSERDGTFDGYSLVLGTTAWLRGYPVNAAALGEAYTGLSLLSGVSSGSPTTWTDGDEVRVTGNFGCAATSAMRLALKERIIGIVRELNDAHHAGGAISMQAMEDAIERVPAARTILRMVEQEYNYRLVSV